jgi:two-component system LytT family response regulator
MSVRILIVDDEALARERLRTLLAGEADCEVVGECSNGLETLQRFETDPPDLLFLDVQMPELDGFEVLEALGDERRAAVVFVTAYDQYALRAFEVHAVDYLLKPFDRERFRWALQRARADLAWSDRGSAPQVRALLADVRKSRAHAERLLVRHAGRIFFVPVADVAWIQAAGNYVELHAGRERHLLRETMKRLETRLDPARFVRIHRSTLVNLERIRSVSVGPAGEHVVELADGTTLPVGRGFRRQFRDRVAPR